jgi:hypothetical protein
LWAVWPVGVRVSLGALGKPRKWGFSRFWGGRGSSRLEKSGDPRGLTAGLDVRQALGVRDGKVIALKVAISGGVSGSMSSGGKPSPRATAVRPRSRHPSRKQSDSARLAPLLRRVLAGLVLRHRGLGLDQGRKGARSLPATNPAFCGLLKRKGAQIAGLPAGSGMNWEGVNAQLQWPEVVHHLQRRFG